MERAREIDIAEVLERSGVGRFQLLTLLLGAAILFVDGLDYSAINVGAPAILRAFHADKSAMGPVFGWGYFGIFVGSVAFGWIGDRFGRKPGAVLGVLAYSIPALLTVFATSLDQVAVFRFLAGIGIGGVVPNTIALLTEMAPKRYRVTFVMISFVGYSTGNATIAQVAAWLIPSYGWTIVFLAAGIAGATLSAVLFFLLPESIPYLAATRPHSPKIAPLVARAAPELAIGPETRWVARRASSEQRFSLKLLFTSYRRIATPLLWIAFFAESLTFMTLSAWFAVILESAGLPPQRAALTFSFGAIGAMAAILTMGRLLDRLGPKAGVISGTLAVAATIALGTPGLSPLAVGIVAVVALACASATHQSLNGIVGGFYPTIVRGNGVGFATGMGRIAAIIGPVAAGQLMAAKFPLQDVLIIIAAPDLVVAACCVALDRLRRTPAAAADFAPAKPPAQPNEQLA